MDTINSSSTIPSQSLAAVQDELMALPAESLRPINLDIQSVFFTVSAALPKLIIFRPVVAATVGEVFAAHIDQVGMYAEAALQANTLWLIASTPPDLQALSEKVVPLREQLHADVVALVLRGLIESSAIAELRGNAGYRNQSSDLALLATVLRTHWEAVAAFTPVKIADLDQAEQLAKELGVALGMHEQSPVQISKAGDLRIRAYTKAIDTYDQIRRAISFIRWNEGDVDQFAPSLWANRGRRRDEGTGPVVVTPVPAQPTTPVVAAPVTPVAVEPASPPIAPGLPGASPFMR